METLNVDQLSHYTLHNMNGDLSSKLDGDIVFVNSAIFPPLDDEFRVAVDNVRKSSEQDHLVVVLETNGGLMETAERLVSVMRTHYKRVSFVIPNYAYSAGTVLALSGDRIYMDHYSVLGPIDPQYPGNDGVPRSGHGALTKYKELTDRINDAQDPGKVRAELAFLLNRFDPAQIFQLEQAVEHGLTLITEWLPKYKFKDWSKTETRGVKVTTAMKESRAREIAKTLGDASKWHSHGRGISMQRLRGDEIKLVIDDFGQDKELDFLIRNYHGFTTDYFGRQGVQHYIHTGIEVRRIA